MNVSYAGTKQILRGIPGSYDFEMVINHGSGYDIFPYTDGLKNFEILFFYTADEVGYDGSLLTTYKMHTAEMNYSIAASELLVNTSQTMKLIVNQGMTIKECLNTTHICFFHRNAMDSMYREKNYTDNVQCLLLGQIKDCEPGKNLFSQYVLKSTINSVPFVYCIFNW